MVGTFRLVKEGKVELYEIVLLDRDAEGFVMKVKHFSNDFAAWEEKADSVDFRLESVEENSATFKGLTFERDGDSLDIKLRMRSKDGSRGVHSMPSIVHMGGFNAGAQLGIVHPLEPKEAGIRGRRVARWKSQHETYRRLLEFLER